MRVTLNEALTTIGLTLVLAVLSGIVGAFLMAQMPLLFCRAGYHRWRVPPQLAMFAGFPQNRIYEQCTRIGCWKTRNVHR